MNDFVFIINNKLHNYKYLKYTIIFYILIIHSYYTLYINLTLAKECLTRQTSIKPETKQAAMQ